LPEEKAAVRVHSGIARLDDELIFCHNGQPAVSNENIDGSILSSRVAPDQPGVRDDDPFGLRGIGSRSYRAGG
jgi:hypothetical protein